jgi:hypothetical protein
VFFFVTPVAVSLGNKDCSAGSLAVFVEKFATYVGFTVSIITEKVTHSGEVTNQQQPIL